MATIPTREEYVQTALSRLGAAGFNSEERVPNGAMQFEGVARRTRIELTKFGFSETFVVFSHLLGGSIEQIRAFSSIAFAYAEDHKSAPLPRGFFYGMHCFAVAVVEELPDGVASSIRRTTPRRHWAANEIPVVYDASTGRLAYFANTPLWGFAYYAGFRRTIERFLLP